MRTTSAWAKWAGWRVARHALRINARLLLQESVTMMTTNAPVPEIMGNGGQARILVPLDGSELAAKALPVAEGLCRQLSAQLDLVSIVPPTVLPYIGGGPYIPGDVYMRIDTERAQEAEKYLVSTAATMRERGIHSQARLGRGDPASGVLDTAKEIGTMLIVMTTHGRTGLARFALGSVADRLVRGGRELRLGSKLRHAARRARGCDLRYHTGRRAPLRRDPPGPVSA